MVKATLKSVNEMLKLRQAKPTFPNVKYAYINQYIAATYKQSIRLWKSVKEKLKFGHIPI